MSSVVENFMNYVVAKNPNEPEFHQAVREVVESVMPVVDATPAYKRAKILERIVEPERTIMFRVPWTDDRGEIRVNKGYRVEFNSALGPYKGGLRFHANVTLSTMKFLGFEQTFKNSLTTLPMGGGKGGSDLDPRGMSDNEMMRFCQAFMAELFRHIGADTDVPAGDIGVGGREIGYLFGMYKKLRNEFTGVLTGKGLNWGGSLVRPEATGFGATYFIEEMLKTRGEALQNKKVAVSGFGNVAWGVALKMTDLGAKVVTISGPDGFVHDPDGIKGEKIDYMLQMRASGRDRVQDYADKFKVEFHAGKRPWIVPCDVAVPAAIQNELDENDARALLKNGVKCVCEAANMPVVPKAVHLFQEAKILFAPGKAANAGGVGTSGLEMSQNAQHLCWAREEVDMRLKQIMERIHHTCLTYGQEGTYTNYVKGANVGGFIKVADAMLDQGLV
ncbi:MAG: NADP-specific glutamate dehydrogenase [Deltaproteobacteria bacterium]|nr:NADP-specific glutamate dehydrogenase [Deltaproteobacteria bacterium]